MPPVIKQAASSKLDELKKVVTVSLTKQPHAQKVGTLFGQCRPKVLGRFAFLSALNLRTESLEHVMIQRFFPRFPENSQTNNGRKNAVNGLRKILSLLQLLQTFSWHFPQRFHRKVKHKIRAFFHNENLQAWPC